MELLAGCSGRTDEDLYGVDISNSYVFYSNKGMDFNLTALERAL